MSRHRAERLRPVRARYGRIAAAATSLMVTAVALLGGVGAIPLGSEPTARTTNSAADLAQGADTPAADTNSTKDGSSRVATADPTALPKGTGSGRRVVFSEAGQRVWLVNAKDRVVTTYLVSGSVEDNLKSGTYAVYSRSRWAVGIDDSGVMQYFVRFTEGDRAAIGFHSIPEKNGTPLQKVAQLGTPQSHGCIRQRLSDAERMWSFAGVGTHVVVV